jgi:hypothetical protein
MHYYLTDWCYFSTVTLLYMLNFDKKNGQLIQMCFLFSNGALALSVAAFRNSVVFHRLDYSISLAIHAVPMITTINLRWNTIPTGALTEGSFGPLPDYSQLAWKPFLVEFFVYPSVLYFTWVLLYFPFLFFIKARRI